MRVVVITPPAPVVTWEEAEQHLELDGDTSKQTQVEAMIAAATAHIDGPDGWLGRAIGAQTLELRLDHFSGPAHCLEIRLPYPPVIEPLSVKYVGSDGVVQTVDNSTFELLGDRIVLGFGQSWPSYRYQREAIRVQYRAGYAAIPAPIKAAILLMVGDLFRFRETADSANSATLASVPMSMTVTNLLSPFRVFI